MFKEILNVHGIVECGVLYGNGTMTFAHLSSILEPVNFTRKIIGFDTFEISNNHAKIKHKNFRHYKCWGNGYRFKR